MRRMFLIALAGLLASATVAQARQNADAGSGGGLLFDLSIGASGEDDPANAAQGSSQDSGQSASQDSGGATSGSGPSVGVSGGGSASAGVRRSEGPALWRVTDEDSVIWLFGTVHLLRPETAWRRPYIEAALRASDVVFFEAPTDPVASAQAQTLMGELGVNDPGRPLSSQLTPAGSRDLDVVLRQAGLARAQVEPLRPWLASLFIAQQWMVNRGFQVDSGVERVLETESARLGKRVGYLESIEQQMRLLAGIPQTESVRSFELGLKEIMDQPEALDSLVAAWAAGDERLLTKLLLEAPSMTPAVYSTLITRRNADWTNQLAQIMAGSGAAFVAVGAAHFMGPDAVQKQLATLGFTVERQ